MTFLQRLLSVSANDERYWTGALGVSTAAGESVSYNTALKVSAYFACVKLISDTIGILPKHVMEYLPDGSRKRAENHPLYDLVHLSPNPQQTSIEFFSMMTAHVVMRNNAYARIVSGPRGFADQIIPLHPDNVRIQTLPEGGYRYMVREGTLGEKPYNDEDILHLRGFQQDIVRGLDMLPLMGESVGVAAATMKYRARFFGNDASPGGVLKKAGKISLESQKNLKESWDAAHQRGNQHRVAVLEDGLEWQSIGIAPEKAQLIESEEFNAEDICRWMGVPPFMIGLTSKSTSWGTGIEQQNIGFVTYTIMPLTVRWQQAISRDLILVPKKYYVDFVLTGLLRGDSAQRYNVYSIGRELGMFTPNDLLRFEDMNPRTDDGGDQYIGDMGRSLSPAQVQGPPPAPMPMEDDEPEEPSKDDAAANVFLIDAAARVARKEIAALNKSAKRTTTRAELMAEARAFYSGHVAHVCEMMHVTPEAARRYCDDGEDELRAVGPECVAHWEERRTRALVKLARNARGTFSLAPNQTATVDVGVIIRKD